MAVALGLTACYVTNTLTIPGAVGGSFALAMALLLGVPDQRSSELLGAAAIWMTVAEFMAAMQDGHFAQWRWAVAVATLAMVLIPLKVQYLRMLARSNPYRTIGELDRRAWSTGVMPVGPGAIEVRRAADPAADQRSSGGSVRGA